MPRTMHGAGGIIRNLRCFHPVPVK